MDDDNSKQDSTPISSGNSDRIQLLKSRYQLAKTFGKKAHDGWKKWINEYNIEDFSDTTEVRDKVRIGYIFRKTESELPAIFDDQPEIFIKGRVPNIKDVEPLINGTYDYLWDTQRMEQKIEDAGLFFELLGMGFASSPWITKTKKVTQTVQNPVLDETGQPTLDEAGQPNMVEEEKEYDVPLLDQPMLTVEDPFKLYFSPETKFSAILDYEHCPYYFKKIVMSADEVKAKYDKEVTATESLRVDEDDTTGTQTGGTTSSSSTTIYSQTTKDDMKRVTVYEYYGCLPESLAKGIKDDEGNKVEWTYDKDYHILFTKAEELLAEESPYPYKPLFIVGNYGMANKFWKFGDAKHLIPLVQEYQQYRNKILQHTRKMVNPKIMSPTTANVDENAFRDPRSGIITKYDGPTAPSYLMPPPLGQEVKVGVEMVQTDLEKTAGSFDLENGGNESTVKTPRGIQVYSEAADKNVRRKRKKMARFIKEIIIFQFMQIAQNWDPQDERVLSIVGENGPEATKVTAEVLQVLSGVNTWYNLDIEVESLSVNRAQIKQDALNLFDIAAQHPDIFNVSEVARYTLQNGYNMKDGDRFVWSDQQKQAMQQTKPEPPRVSVAIKADAATPPGAQLLENEGLIQKGQAESLVQADQLVKQHESQIQADQQSQSAGMQAGIQSQQATQQAGLDQMTQNASQPLIQPQGR